MSAKIIAAMLVALAVTTALSVVQCQIITTAPPAIDKEAISIQILERGGAWAYLSRELAPTGPRKDRHKDQDWTSWLVLQENLSGIPGDIGEAMEAVILRLAVDLEVSEAKAEAMRIRWMQYKPRLIYRRKLKEARRLRDRVFIRRREG